MSYFLLLIAGIAEIGWAIGMKFSDGFTKPIPSFLTIVLMILSVWFLSISIKDIPLGTAYAIWTGIGALGAFIAGIILFGEALTTARVISMSFLSIGLIGLKISST